ncbi:hypothetical protein CVT24_010024 [Panaeolus cyanescens]|uniref:Peptidase M12A domain-containing protein n=1 Tax=Panaeolus cyanescens TaxID=181874 RepID=A0A409W3W6_9AGAR|nr:hypothetical protein CVT24_010024 [Panaeolus cyanescens]
MSDNTPIAIPQPFPDAKTINQEKAEAGGQPEHVAVPAPVFPAPADKGAEVLNETQAAPVQLSTTVVPDDVMAAVQSAPGQPIVELPQAAPIANAAIRGVVSTLINDEEPKRPKQDWYKLSCAEAVHPTKHGNAFLSRTSARTGGSRALMAVMARSSQMWDAGATLTYSFMDDTYDEIKADKVRNTIGEWSKYGDIMFEERDIGENPLIRISFDSTTGSWSYVGNEVAGIPEDEATLNLGWVTSNPTITDKERGVILHEFGHTLGLMHEHQSPMRGNKITLDEEAVYAFYMDTQKWTASDVKTQIIDVYNDHEISNYSEFDPESIMIYFMPAAMNKQRRRIEPTTCLSPTDKAFITINYPSFPAKNGESQHFEDPRKTFIDALDVAGVDGDYKDRILKLYDQEDWKEIRFEFHNFCTVTRVARRSHEAQSRADDANEGPSHAINPTSRDIFQEGCLAEDEDEGDNVIQRRGGSPAKGLATVHNDLWLPGEEITYTWVQTAVQATPYRKQRVRETFAAYAKVCNLTFKEVAYDPQNLFAKIHFYFGDIPARPDAIITGWSKIGRQSVGLRRSAKQIEKKGGSVESSIVFNDIAVPPIAPTEEQKKRRELRTLFHEMGHALGLKHEHTSPHTLTDDEVTQYSVATPYDPDSIMLYAGRALRKSPNFKESELHLDSNYTQFNHLPSKLDLAFLGALYPARPNHVDDKFEADITTLGLKAKYQQLNAQRVKAFKVEGHAEYPKEITKLREMLQAELSILATRKSHAIQRAPMFAASAPAKPKATTGSFLDIIVETLSSLFQPTTGQIFALQFPGRFLQKDLYAWETKKAGIYGQFVKPAVVNESEFRLVDQLYNAGKVIGAPNGTNLSIVYEQVLNNLVPGIEQSAINMSKQQADIRKWLLRDVPVSGWVKDLIDAQHNVAQTTKTATGGRGPARAINASSAVNAEFAVNKKLSSDDKITRMELAEALMHEYLTAKQAWEEERDRMILNKEGLPLEDVTRKLAHITAIREAQLAAKYSDAVVRGYSHTIRQYMGYMDIKSPAEILQDAKDSLRESSTSSLDGSMKIYPVQMQPIDWFESLSTSFSMEDLSEDPNLLMMQLSSKSKQLDSLNARLTALAAAPKTDIAKLQAELDTAQAQYDNAQIELSKQYTSNIIAIAKACINSDNKFQLDIFKKKAGDAGVAEDAYQGIENGMQALSAKQLTVTQASRAVAQLAAAKTLASASDTTQEIVQINVAMTSLQREIDELTARIQTMSSKLSATDGTSTQAPKRSIEDIPDLVPETGVGAGSRWQEVRLFHEVSSFYKSTSEESKSSTSRNDVSLFFGSYHSDSTSSSSQSKDSEHSSSLKVNVGFRATMVTVDRGGWFQPQLLKQSNAFYSIDPKITWNKWPKDATFQDFKTNGDPKIFDDINKYLLPSYPVGFLVCKDITIKIAMSSTDIEKSGAAMQETAASSAGVLCWSTSSASQSSSSTNTCATELASDGLVIRIPGPQILGYILQITDSDQAQPLPTQLPPGFLIPDDQYDNTLNAPPHPTN